MIADNMEWYLKATKFTKLKLLNQTTFCNQNSISNADALYRNCDWAFQKKITSSHFNFLGFLKLVNGQ